MFFLMIHVWIRLLLSAIFSFTKICRYCNQPINFHLFPCIDFLYRFITNHNTPLYININIKELSNVEHRIFWWRFYKWYRRYLTFKTPTPKFKCHFSSPCWNHWEKSLAPNWLSYRGVSLILHTSLTSSIKARYIKALWHIIDTRGVQYLTSRWSQLL